MSGLSVAGDLERRLSQAGIEARFDRLYRGLYATDASVYQIMPMGVAFPRHTGDVQEILAACRELGVSITPRGAGTSQAGQAIGEGLQVDFTRHMNQVLEVDPGHRRVRAQPGIVLDDLNAALKPHGLHLPVDISTTDRATIGGMVANNSGGTRSVIYGKLLDFVEELTVLLADGTIVRLDATDAADLPERCARPGSEGRCWSTVSRLGSELAAEIDARYPKILRRVGGYNLDEFTPERESFNLARMIVGSEGTLGIVLDAELRVTPMPACRGLLSVQFDSLLDALEAVPQILEHSPSAIELIDRFILDSTRGKTDYEPLRSFLHGDPAALLVVELFGESDAEITERLAALEADLFRRTRTVHVHRAKAPAEQAKIWKLRRAALGLSMAERGDSKAISFVEDTAVDPARLRDYIERFQELLARHETRAGFYAHASVGLLHIRPVVNLKSADGVRRFEAIASDVADLVLEFGGALSGEHGDGLVRAPFQERMFGPVLYAAFREIKHAFDPTGILNPGKIVDSSALRQNLRFGTDYHATEPLTVLSFEDYGGLARAAEQCGGIGECRKRSGTMCPSYMATRDELHSTRGRANTLRLALSGELGAAGLSDPTLREAFDLCLECKACKSECPTGVDMARMKAEFTHQQHQTHGIPIRDRVLGRVAGLAEWGRLVAPLANAVNRSAAGRALLSTLLGLDARRTLPAVVRQGCVDALEASAAGPGAPWLFVDTFTEFFEPEIGFAAERVIRALGGQARPMARVCCGRPLLSRGLLTQARTQAELFLASAPAEGEIVFLEPSCHSAVVDDLPVLVSGTLGEQAAALAERCLSLEAWIARRGTTSVSTDASEVVLAHPHCHQRALGGVPELMAMLTALGAQPRDPEAGCCGLAGLFGHEVGHYDVSTTIGEQRLAPEVRAAPESMPIIAAGFSCRSQIRHLTGRSAVHPAVYADRRLKNSTRD